MKVKAPTGDIVEGETFEDVVREMSMSKLRHPRSLARFRKAVSRRGRDANIYGIDDSSNENFVRSLCGLGLAEWIEEP